MSLAISILASGSSGNCSVVRAAGRAILIDCGIGPRTAASRMKGLGIGISDISAICLTHLDTDHFNLNWVRQILRQKIFLFCHRQRIDDLLVRANNPDLAHFVRSFDGNPFFPLENLQCMPIGLAHDEHGSHGFVLESGNLRIGYATDLGRITTELIHQFCGVDVLAIESNYDPQMQLDSGRPWFLKRRIMGGRGHLSNPQALQAIQAILDRSRQAGKNWPGHIVLLHRSRQCNCPNLLRDLFSRDRRIASRLTLAEQDQPTIWLDAASTESYPLPHEQLQIQWNGISHGSAELV